MAGQAPPVADERDGLLTYLKQQRTLLTMTAYGMTDEQARMAPTAGTLSVGGLIKHVAQTERSWMDSIRGTQTANAPDFAAYADGFTLREDETLADVIADLEKAGEETEALIAGIADLGQDVPVDHSVPWNPKDVDNWSVRWVLLHLIEEVARHTGHADMVREAVDGATWFPLLAASEGWPETPWLTPWSPPAEG